MKGGPTFRLFLLLTALTAIFLGFGYVLGSITHPPTAERVKRLKQLQR